VSAAAGQADNARGVLFMVVTMAIFATQDALSKHLVERYSVLSVTMIRYWFFALFVVALAARAEGGLRAAARTAFPVLQCVRGVLLVAEIVVMTAGFALLGLVASHAVFTCYALIVTALSGPFLGERVGWRRWAAIGVGFVGVLIILKPGTAVFDPLALIPLTAAFMFAVYNLLTRHVGRVDRAATSFFYTGVAGAAAITLAAPFYWDPPQGWDWGWMALLCVTGVTAHFFLIKALELAEASAVQPFTYLHLVFAALIGTTVFGETVETSLLLGGALIVAAGLFTIWRERVRRGRG
jgi:drug/metabolite transporter (DMT)-like permease